MTSPMISTIAVASLHLKGPLNPNARNLPHFVGRYVLATHLIERAAIALHAFASAKIRTL